MDQLLLQLGLGIASNTIYDFLKDFFAKNPKVDRSQLENGLISFLNIRNANIVADKIIAFLAQNGDIRIEGTSIYAKDAFIQGHGGAGIKQNEDGSISFSA